MDLTLQLHHGGKWHDAAAVTIPLPDAGIKGATTTAYENAYFLDHGAIALSEDNPVQDARALSVRFPIDLVSRGLPTWPPFLLDLLPQGHQRRKLAGHLNLDPDAASTDIHLLMRSAGAPIGNLRIKEAHLQELERAKELPRIGVDKEDILGRTDRFLEVVDRFAMQASGSSGLQGDWPKVAMTMARDGKWYPDSIVSDADAVVHVIVKLLRSNDDTDRLILAAEAGYAAVAKDFGLTVRGVSEHRDGVLVIPRFDRAVVGGRLVRHGQESLVSALGVAEFGHIDTHENYLAVLRRLSTDPIRDVTEYVLRDVLNLAMGNPDNHGRNTALQKTAAGGIRLAPLYDFAPMRLSPAVVMRSTKWECMKPHGRDYDPDWAEICNVSAADEFPANHIMESLLAKEETLRSLPDLARRHGVSEAVIERALDRHRDIADRVSELRARVPNPPQP